MALFCITQSKEVALDIKKDYDELFPQQSSIYQLGENNAFFLTVTTGYNKKLIYKEIDNNFIFIMGTIFNEMGFNAEILEKTDNYEVFWELVYENKQNFFGHYIVIGYNKELAQLRIVTDRIGLLNVYYTCYPNINISNDIIEVGKISGNTELDMQASMEFAMTESNVNERTIFQGIRRLGLGKSLLWENNSLEEIEVYEYRIDHLDKKAYVERIDRYFSYINQFKGRIGVDISAGFDTRLVSAIAHKRIDSFCGFTVNNKSDGGIDNEISSIIGERLKIPITYLDYDNFKVDKEQSELIYHCTSGLRDACRSRKWLILFSKRFADCDLSLGGYGGEIIRAKYNKYPNIKQFVNYYYKGMEAEKVYGIKGYKEELEKELKSYKKPSNMIANVEQNWYYAVARMRIWGSAFLQMGSMYGDIIHPFMDWYLMGPIFGFQLEELKDGKMQKEMIDIYAPELKDLPINKFANKSKTVKQILISLWKKLKFDWKWSIVGSIRYIRLKIFCILHHKGIKDNSRMIHVENIKKYLDLKLKNKE